MSKSDDDIREENKEESSRYLKNYKRMNKYFVETKAYCDAKETFHKNGIVILTGPPGCGKTIAAIHMILEQKDNNEQKMTFRNIQSWEELSYVNRDKQTIVLIDNIFFRRTMNLHLENWWAEFEKNHNNFLYYQKLFFDILNDIGSEAQKMSGAFFKRIREDAYKFVHDSVYEAVGA